MYINEDINEGYETMTTLDSNLFNIYPLGLSYVSELLLYVMICGNDINITTHTYMNTFIHICI